MALAKIAITIGWAFWAVVGWVLFAALGFGNRHEILITMAVFVLMPPILLAARRVAGIGAETRTLLLVVVIGVCLYVLVVLAVMKDWVGVAAQY